MFVLIITKKNMFAGLQNSQNKRHLKNETILEAHQKHTFPDAFKKFPMTFTLKFHTNTLNVFKQKPSFCFFLQALGIKVLAIT